MYRQRHLRIVLGILWIPLLLSLHEPEFISATLPVDSNVDTDWMLLNNADKIGRYFRKGGIIHVHLNAWFSDKLKDADPGTFRVHKKFGEFGRDKSHIWFISSELSVDHETWEPLSQCYSRDKLTVYCGVHQLPDADPGTFKLIGEAFGDWGADRQSVYSQWFKLENSDPQTFQFIDSSFSMDKNNVYFLRNRLDGADPSSFEVIAVNVAKDKKSIFAFGKKMPNYIDRESVRVPGDGYIYDKNGRYHLYKGEWIKTEP